MKIKFVLTILILLTLVHACKTRQKRDQLEYTDESGVYNNNGIDTVNFIFKDRPFVKEKKEKVLEKAGASGFCNTNIVKVSTPEEFVRALADSTTILVESGKYIFEDSDALGKLFNQQRSGLKSYEGFSPFYRDGAIRNITGLTIIGIGPTTPIFLQPDGYNHVLSFLNAKGVFISNIIFGHHPDLGWCKGGVLLFMESSHVQVDNSVLFGCGTEGLSLVTVEGFELSHSLITHCTEQLFTMSNVRKASIRNSIIKGNKAELRGFALYASEVNFDNTIVSHEAFSFSMNAGDYKEEYSELFVIDRYDFGNWYTDEVVALSPPIEKTVVTFHKCKVNDQPADGTLK